MQKLRLKSGVIDQIKKDRNLASDAQAAAILGVTVDQVEAMRHGAAISPAMALHVAVVQGSGYDLSRWAEPLTSTIAA